MVDVLEGLGHEGTAGECLGVPSLLRNLASAEHGSCSFQATGFRALHGRLVLTACRTKLLTLRLGSMYPNSIHFGPQSARRLV